MEYNELRDIMLDNKEDKKSKSVKRILVRRLRYYIFGGFDRDEIFKFVRN